MDDEKGQSKAEKKSSKAQHKRLKKFAKTGADAPPAASTQTDLVGLSPAERSARAAEKQVHFQRLRVVIALVAVVVAVMSLWVALRSGTRAGVSPIVNPPAGAAGHALPHKSGLDSPDADVGTAGK